MPAFPRSSVLLAGFPCRRSLHWLSVLAVLLAVTSPGSAEARLARIAGARAGPPDCLTGRVRVSRFPEVAAQRGASTITT
jgi:hypothetical protein